MAIKVPTDRVSRSRLFMTALTVNIPTGSERGGVSIAVARQNLDDLGGVIDEKLVNAGLTLTSAELGPDWQPLADSIIALFEKHAPIAIERDAKQKAERKAETEERHKAQQSTTAEEVDTRRSVRRVAP